jgi:hypothetical protein
MIASEPDVDRVDRTAEPVPSAPTALKSRWVRFSHLFAISGFAFAQPLLDRISQHTPYLIDLQFNRTGILVLAAAIMLLVPGVLLGLVELVGWRRPKTRLIAHYAAIGSLSFLAGLSIGRVFLSRPPLRDHGVPWFVHIAAAAACAVVFSVLYARRARLRQFVGIASLGAIAFPIQFLFASPVCKLVIPPPPQTALPTVHAERPAPIVMVVFDEFDGLALMDRQGRIDDDLFPNFGRLAKKALWFPSATAVHYRTERALPALLTGSYAPHNVASTELEFPDNLFALIRRSGQYQTLAFEPFTRLCKPDPPAESKPTVSVASRVAVTAVTLSKVYVNALLPPDSPLTPPIPRSWFSMGDVDRSKYAEGPNVRRFPWDLARKELLTEFLSILNREDQPTLHFLHVGLPHNPWMYLPSGKNYEPKMRFPMRSKAFAQDEIWIDDDLAVLQSWERYVWQLQFVDRFIGELIDTLQARGLWDESLVVVTADHGVSFVPNQPRRIPVRENAPEIASVPLFIKLPTGQPSLAADVTARNVETIDIVPSIASALGLTLPTPVDGSSVFDRDRPDRPRKTMQLDQQLLLLRPDFSEKMSALAGMHDRFAPDGPARADRDLPKWSGMAVSEMTVSDQPAREITLTLGGDVATEEVVPCFIEGEFDEWDSSAPPSVVALALNGRIETVTRTYRDASAAGCWAGAIREEAYHLGQNRLEIFEVVDAAKKTLRQCTWVRVEDF